MLAMKYWKEYQQNLKRNISLLADENKMRFAIEICHRLLPEYEKFYIKHEWGNYQFIVECLNYCQENSNLLKINLQTIEELIEKIDAVIPDTEDFGDLEGSFALNAGTAIESCLMFLKDRRDKHIINVASYMYDTIDFIVQEENENISTEERDSHPKILEERKWQLEKLRALAN